MADTAEKIELVKDGSVLKGLIIDGGLTTDQKIDLTFSEPQLWYIYLGLERLELVDELKKGTDDMAGQIMAFGQKYFNWA